LDWSIGSLAGAICLHSRVSRRGIQQNGAQMTFQLYWYLSPVMLEGCFSFSKSLQNISAKNSENLKFDHFHMAL
jgi:hypothetical protein